MKAQIKIGNRYIGKACPVFIIAEAGVNHNGSIKLAKKMIDAAKSSGADAIKFQTFKTENLVTINAPKAGYQKRAVPFKSQFEMLKSLELSRSDFVTLFNYCRKEKIIFLSTAFDTESAEFLWKLGVPAFKISSGELTNLPLLMQIAGYRKPVIMSTGMADLQEVKEGIKAVYSRGNKKLVLLHCTSNYPARFEDLNLKAMLTLKKAFNVPIGYSDHTDGIHIAVSAVSMGASVIEKHFTLDRNFQGPDHRASIEPEGLREMVKNIRDIEKAMGSGIKSPAESENEMKKAARKSIVVDMDIRKGSRLAKGMLAIKRPGTGINPKYFNKIIGKYLACDCEKGRVLTWDLIR